MAFAVVQASRAVGSEVILPWDPENLPGEGWPGRDARESSAAWPTGQQPPSLVAWEMDDDRPEPCWKVSVLHDTVEGWPGQCDGLDRVETDREEECEDTCRRNPTCGMWQFTDLSQCFQGEGFHCDDGGGRGPVGVRRAQRLQHGDVRVLRDMTGWDVFNLRSLGLWDTGNVTDGVGRCRNYCYSQIFCQYWQYGEGGCYVEDPRSEYVILKEYEVQYPLTTDGGVSNDTDFARTAIAGEYIQHICPAKVGPTTTPAPSFELWGVPLGALRSRLGSRWLLFACLFVLPLAICSCWSCFRSKSGQAKQKRTRSHSADLLEQDGEDGEVESDQSTNDGQSPEVLLEAAQAAAVPTGEQPQPNMTEDLQERRPPGTRAAAPFSYMPLGTGPPPERVRSLPLLNAPPSLRLPPQGAPRQPAAAAGAPAAPGASVSLPAPQAPAPMLQAPSLPVPRLPILQLLQNSAVQEPVPRLLQGGTLHLQSASVKLPPRERPVQPLRFRSLH